MNNESQTLTAVVNFRTMALGAYKWVKRGQRRGYWRVLLVRDSNGSHSCASNNVESVLWTGSEGIDGVTERSAYCIDSDLERAQAIAAEHNA